MTGNQNDCPTTQQLWSMQTPIGAAWTESMRLGYKYHDQARDEFFKDVQAKNAYLAEQLGVCAMQLNLLKVIPASSPSAASPVAACDPGCEQEAKLIVERELEEARERLAVYQQREEELDEQDRLARRIWGARRMPDASWDRPAELVCPARAKPLTVGKIISELGYKATPARVHRVCAHVQEAYTRAHGRVPVPVVYYDETGTPDRVSCYTEDDRELITDVVRGQHAMLQQATT
jgi:hypothetical protein